MTNVTLTIRMLKQEIKLTKFKLSVYDGNKEYFKSIVEHRNKLKLHLKRLKLNKDLDLTHGGILTHPKKVKFAIKISSRGDVYKVMV